jgi:hypothetical protein
LEFRSCRRNVIGSAVVNHQGQGLGEDVYDVHYDVQRCERENIGDSMTGAKRDFDLVIMKE